MKANIKLSLDLLNPVRLLALLRNVIAKMTGNANFPTPAVSLPDLETMADDLQAAIELATDGSRQAKLARNALVLQAQDLLRKQADYVRSVCLGDAALLATSGFELAKQREPIGIPGIPQRVETRITGRKRELMVKWRTVHGAHGYQVWMSESDPAVEANWVAIGYTTRVSHLVTELEPYKAYFFCISAIGAAGEGMQSDPAMGRAA